MTKMDMQDLIDIIYIKNTRLNDKNGVTNMSYNFSKQHLCKEMQFNNFLIAVKFKIILCFEVIVLSDGNTCIAYPNLQVLITLWIFR